MKAKLYTQSCEAKGEVDLPEEVFGVDVDVNLMHFVVKHYLANQRQGTAKTKGRSEVSGGGVKPFKQKGTGRARAGSNTSPLWVRGGKSFGAQPRNYTKSISKKVRRASLKSAFSARASENGVLVMEKIVVSEPKTKEIFGILSGLSVKDAKNLLIVDSDMRNVYLSGRNIKNLNIKALSDVNTYDVLNCDNVIFGALELVEKVKEVVL